MTNSASTAWLVETVQVPVCSEFQLLGPSLRLRNHASFALSQVFCQRSTIAAAL